MRRTVVSVCLLILVGLSLPTVAESAGRCDKPKPKHRYTPDHMTVQLSYPKACGPSGSSTVRLSGDMKQTVADTPLGESTSGSTKCPIKIKDANASSARTDWASHCTLRLRIDHAQVDESTYTGSFLVSGKNGRIEIDFYYSCATLIVAACE